MHRIHYKYNGLLNLTTKGYSDLREQNLDFHSNYDKLYKYFFDFLTGCSGESVVIVYKNNLDTNFGHSEQNKVSFLKNTEYKNYVFAKGDIMDISTNGIHILGLKEPVSLDILIDVIPASQLERKSPKELDTNYNNPIQEFFFRSVYVPKLDFHMFNIDRHSIHKNIDLINRIKNHVNSKLYTVQAKDPVSAYLKCNTLGVPLICY